MDYTVLLIFGFGLTSCSHVLLREYHYINLSVNWADAQHYCRVKHTDLATIESMDDISRLNRPNMDTSLAWIGLSDDPQSWKGAMGNDANSWRWSATGTTSITGYHKWGNQSNNLGGNQTCVLVYMSGTWNDEDCHFKRYFVCYTATNPPGRKTYTEITITLTWKDAQAYCRTHYTDLAMIENAQENTEMLSIKSTHVVWIGLYRVPWMWSDKSNSSFTNWGSGQPNNYGGNQYCVAENSHHLWDDVSCDKELSFFCHGALKVKMTMVRMKFQTDADLSDPATNVQILQQLGAVLTNKTSLTDFNLGWKIQPRKQEEENDEAN